MNYQNYEEYMQNILGYSLQDPNIYESYRYSDNATYDNTYYRNNYEVMLTEDDVKEFYPEIYHVINPVVCKICEANSAPITRELVEKMTDEVYNAIEDTDTVVNVRIETPKENNRTIENKESRTPKRMEENRDTKAPKRVEENRSSISRIGKENVKNIQTANNMENRESRAPRRRNPILRDLIKILILGQLLGGRPPVRPPRPPYPGGPGMPNPRPPYPGGRPPMGGPGNPPIRPRNYEDYLKF